MTCRRCAARAVIRNDRVEVASTCAAQGSRTALTPPRRRGRLPRGHGRRMIEAIIWTCDHLIGCAGCVSARRDRRSRRVPEHVSPALDTELRQAWRHQTSRLGPTERARPCRFLRWVGPGVERLATLPRLVILGHTASQGCCLTTWRLGGRRTDRQQAAIPGVRHPRDRGLLQRHVRRLALDRRPGRH